MSLRNIDTETGLTPSEIKDLSALTNLVLAHPKLARQVIIDSGLEPASTPQGNVIQIARASMIKPVEFEGACRSINDDEYDEFLGGMGAAVIGLGKKVGGIFKKGSGAGEKVKGFFRRVFNKDARQEWKEGKEDRQAERQAKRQQRRDDRQAERSMEEEEEYQDQMAAERRREESGVTVTEEEEQKAVDKLTKTNKNLMIGLIAAGVAFVGVLIWAFAT